MRQFCYDLLDKHSLRIFASGLGRIYVTLKQLISYFQKSETLSYGNGDLEEVAKAFLILLMTFISEQAESFWEFFSADVYKQNVVKFMEQPFPMLINPLECNQDRFRTTELMVNHGQPLSRKHSGV